MLVADIAHIAGLVAGGAHPSPVGLAPVITSTSHKSLRGPRGAMIPCDEAQRSSIDKAVFPGLQGGPHNHTTAAMAVAAQEAATDEFRAYAARVVDNARVLAEGLLSAGLELVSGGTDNHLILIDLSDRGISGKGVARAMDRAGIVANYNSVPFDRRRPFDPSGVRIGTPAITTRGMGAEEMKSLARFIARVVERPEDEAGLDRIAEDVRSLCQDFPVPGAVD